MSLAPGNKVLLAALNAMPTEHNEQVVLFRWADVMKAKHPELAELFAVPNGARTSMTVAKKLKAEGLKAGVEDVILLVARGGYHGLCIELKRRKPASSNVSADQKEWHKRHMLRGYKVAVCYGAEEAQTVLLEYLAQPKTKVAA